MRCRHAQKWVSDFEIHTLTNDHVSLSIAPAIGGRIVSLRDRVSRREWLDGWSPVSKRRIWYPTDPANFETGPGAGIDECLPTVLPCKWNGVSLPDHGELWNQSPDFSVDQVAGFFCRWNIKSLPLAFERRIALRENEIHFDYQIENRADAPTPFLWAWHPLFTWKPGDQIKSNEKNCISPGGTETLAWPVVQSGTDLSRALFPRNATQAAKVFLGPLTHGVAEIQASSGAHLSLNWPSALFPYAGIWITRGFWKGLHHWAIEPTNAPVDRLSEIHEPSSVSLLAPLEVRKWTLTVKVSPKQN